MFIPIAIYAATGYVLFGVFGSVTGAILGYIIERTLVSLPKSATVFRYVLGILSSFMVGAIFLHGFLFKDDLNNRLISQVQAEYDQPLQEIMDKQRRAEFQRDSVDLVVLTEIKDQRDPGYGQRAKGIEKVAARFDSTSVKYAKAYTDLESKREKRIAGIKDGSHHEGMLAEFNGLITLAMESWSNGLFIFITIALLWMLEMFPVMIKERLKDQVSVYTAANDLHSERALRTMQDEDFELTRSRITGRARPATA
jgi:hypothetical protein